MSSQIVLFAGIAIVVVSTGLFLRTYSNGVKGTDREKRVGPEGAMPMPPLTPAVKKGLVVAAACEAVGLALIVVSTTMS